MFAGHVGAALAIGRLERRINVGAIVFAALLLDVLLWLFVLLGLETVTIADTFAATHQPDFVFPYSHGLSASLGWSVLAGLAAIAWYARSEQRKFRGAGLLAAAVFSHWLLDALVHVPEVPLAGASSPKVGLGLWQNMPAALSLESLLLVVGCCMFILGSRLSRARKIRLTVLAVVILVFTLAGMTVAPPPPSAMAMAASSLITIAVVCALIGWLGRPPR